MVLQVVGAKVKTLETFPYSQGGSGASARTDKEGRYQLDRLRPSVYNLSVSLNDDLKKEWSFGLQNYELQEGERKKGFDVELVKGGLIKGRVTMSDTGESVSDILIGLSLKDSSASLDQHWITTDKNGEYEYRLPAGEHNIYLTGEVPEGYSAKIDKNKSVSRKVLIKKGQIYEVDFKLPKAVTVNGVVLDEDGAPVTGAEVVGFFDVSILSEDKVMSGESGKFSFSVPPGTTALKIEANLGEMTSEKGKEYEIDSLVKVLIRKEADSDYSAEMSGKVIDVQGKPLEGVTVLTFDGVNKKTVKTDSEGVYVFEKIHPKQQSLFYSKEGYGVNDRHEIPKAQKRSELDPVILPIADASLTGKLIDEFGNPVEGARLVASGENQPRGSALSGATDIVEFDTVTDKEGKFKLDGLIKGWLDVGVAKKTLEGSNYTRVRLKTGTDSILTLNKSNVKVGRLEEVNLVGKMAPQLIAEHWLNTEKVYPAVSSKARLIQFVGTNRPFIYYSNFVATMEKLRKEFPEEELEIILVHGMWPKLEVEEIIVEDYPKLTLPVAIESRENAMSDAFGVNSWLTVVIDNQGKVVWQNSGSRKKLRELLKRLLSK